MPNHLPSVEPIWSTDVVGIHEPLLPASSGRPRHAAAGTCRTCRRRLTEPPTHELMAAPRVVDAGVRVADERAVEVRHRELHDVVRDARRDRVVVERLHRREQLVEEVRLVGDRVRVRVVAAHAHEEELALDARRGAAFDQPRDLPQLLRDAGVEQRAVDA